MAMRIDAHQHFWRYEAGEYAWIDRRMEVLRRDFLPESLAPVLSRHHMDASLAVQARPDERENDFLLQLAAGNDSIAGVIGWVDFCSPAVGDALERWSAYPKMKGYRAMVQDEPNPSEFMTRADFNAGVSALQHKGGLYELLVRSADLEAATAFCARHDQGPIVLCHMGKPDLRLESAEEWAGRLAPLAELAHVSCKLSGLITEAPWHAWRAEDLLPYMRAAIGLFGPDRLLFGSDWPVCLCSGRVDAVYRLAESALAILDEYEQDQVWGENARRIYAL
jgi:L-fuconolactonase